MINKRSSVFFNEDINETENFLLISLVLLQFIWPRYNFASFFIRRHWCIRFLQLLR